MRVTRELPKKLSACAAGLALGSAVLFATGCGASPVPGLVPIGAGLDGPAGLRATVYATGLPLMSAFAFDAQGRLWVTTSGDTTHGSDGVYVIERMGAQPVKVISGPKAPLGLLWYGNELIVSSLGRVTAFNDLRRTRFAKRTTILRGPAGGGENNNLILAPDGRLLMGVSASCDHCTPPTKWSGAIVSFKPDGSDLRLFASRIRAPFGLGFYPGTNDLLATMNQRDDLGARTPGDWVALVRQGENWGFPACYGQAGALCARVSKPIAVLDPHAAVGGIAMLTTELGGRFASSALVAEWKLGKVQRVALRTSGSSYTGSVAPFLTGLKHPLPVIATRSGTVLVGDWGTGKIYRITSS